MSKSVVTKDVISLPMRKDAHKVQKKRKKAVQKRESSAFNKKALMWLVLFFPLGVTYMWRHACTWRRGVKFAVTGAMVCVLAALFMLPAAPTHQGGITLVGARPEAEIYGPELPAKIVSGYVKPATGSVLVEVEGETDIHYVYAADGAECYHEYKCKFAFASSQRLTVYEAYFLGFKPCGLCNPPSYSR